MRTSLIIALAAATVLSTPAAARDHHRHHGHHDSHHWSKHNRYSSSRHHYRAYASPYRGWNYRRVSVGYRLRPAFYGPRYVVTNYGYYGIRAPGRHLRWIRYGNDLLLVDIRYGQVIRVIPGGFYY